MKDLKVILYLKENDNHDKQIDEWIIHPNK